MRTTDKIKFTKIVELIPPKGYFSRDYMKYLPPTLTLISLILSYIAFIACNFLKMQLTSSSEVVSLGIYCTPINASLWIVCRGFATLALVSGFCNTIYGFVATLIDKRRPVLSLGILTVVFQMGTLAVYGVCRWEGQQQRQQHGVTTCRVGEGTVFLLTGVVLSFVAIALDERVRRGMASNESRVVNLADIATDTFAVNINKNLSSIEEERDADDGQSSDSWSSSDDAEKERKAMRIMQKEVDDLWKAIAARDDDDESVVSSFSGSDTDSWPSDEFPTDIDEREKHILSVFASNPLRRRITMDDDDEDEQKPEPFQIPEHQAQDGNKKISIQSAQPRSRELPSQTHSVQATKVASTKSLKASSHTDDTSTVLHRNGLGTSADSSSLASTNSSADNTTRDHSSSTMGVADENDNVEIPKMNEKPTPISLEMADMFSKKDELESGWPFRWRNEEGLSDEQQPPDDDTDSPRDEIPPEEDDDDDDYRGNKIGAHDGRRGGGSGSSIRDRRERQPQQPNFNAGLSQSIARVRIYKRLKAKIQGERDIVGIRPNIKLNCDESRTRRYIIDDDDDDDELYPPSMVDCPKAVNGFDDGSEDDVYEPPQGADGGRGGAKYSAAHQQEKQQKQQPAVVNSGSIATPANQ